MPQSALSHAIWGLEEQVGVRLLARTTRSVAPTEAGEQLLSELRPALTGIRDALDRIGGLRDQPSGHVRLLAPRLVAMSVLGPKLAEFARTYPDVMLDVSTGRNEARPATASVRQLPTWLSCGTTASVTSILRHAITYAIMMAMLRTQVQLTEKQAAALRRRSKRENVSVAELVRQAIDAFTRAEPPSDREVRDRAIRAAGRFASGVHDTSLHHDEALADAFRSR